MSSARHTKVFHIHTKDLVYPNHSTFCAISNCKDGGGREPLQFTRGAVDLADTSLGCDFVRSTLTFDIE